MTQTRTNFYDPVPEVKFKLVKQTFPEFLKTRLNWSLVALCLGIGCKLAGIFTTWDSVIIYMALHFSLRTFEYVFLNKPKLVAII